jgi:hypothetical protein
LKKRRETIVKTQILIRYLGVVLTIAALPCGAETVAVKADTRVAVELTENVHSAFNTQGEIIYLRIAEELSVDGKTVVSKGALVEALVDNTVESGMAAKSGRIYFHPVRILAADGQWLELDPMNFGDEGEGAGAGMIFAIGPFAKGTPGFVPRGTIYHVTTRRDKEVEIVALRPPRETPAAEVMLSGRVKPLKTVDLKRTKPGRNIEFEFDLPEEIEPLVPTGATDVEIVSFIDYVPETPVPSITVVIDSRKHLLRASFDWWSIVKYSQPESTALTVQFELSDGRLAQADIAMESIWKTP